ncbi:PREDICTED: receptor-like cytosolic serine/threonine-protein kinase RBK1 [Fragaria vesca subsp. vesca]|uniref:receptor-like cytosolic serine/threonine-protein kinase RBK1 n=1 Tax=Fragaria vesca subsp. vesca TaxID=101020 RepID=UPI0002C32DEC|nr:PREDICTED: receptor-like cytosolic serine/threonine-protein kinase RBK1 [Fragaria vesca subsp. vesca]
MAVEELVSETKGKAEIGNKDAEIKAELENADAVDEEIKSQDDLKKAELCEQEPSPRGVLEALGTDSDSSSSCASSFSSDRPPLSQQGTLGREISNGMQWNKGKEMFDALKKKSARRFSMIPMLGNSYEFSSRKLRKRLARIWSTDDDDEEEREREDCEGYLALKPSWRNFDYAELAAATADFKPDNLIGKGGQAEVYKGILNNGEIVAVKRLMKKEKEVEKEDRIGDFLAELGVIAHISHPNAAKLLGFGIDGGLHLVLQYSPHGSLASLLFASEKHMEWKIRFKVAVGVAEGLQYLHHDCHRRIIHRDIKASNILLSEDFEAQISDFGLAKWLPEKWTHHVVFPIEGTFGYLSPEYFMHGIVDEKTDVFAYGVLLLEIITGRRAVDNSQQSLVIWAKPLLDSGNMKELADPRLEGNYDPVEIKRAMLVASMCIRHQSTKRPYMTRVVKILEGEDPNGEQLKQKSTQVRSQVLDACDLEDYTCSNYLSDLNRHRELVMDQ